MLPLNKISPQLIVVVTLLVACFLFYSIFNLIFTTSFVQKFNLNIEE